MSETHHYAVKLEMGDMGEWTMRAPECPANVLRKQLGEAPWSCRAGLSTNAQGAIPLSKCPHLIGEVEDADGSMIVICGFQIAAAAEKGEDDE